MFFLQLPHNGRGGRRSKRRRNRLSAAQGSVGSCRFIHRAPVRPDDLNVLATDASKLYRHAEEPILLVLTIGGEGILMHDDNRDFGWVSGTCVQNLAASFRSQR